jgi:hypothetical protein
MNAGEAPALHSKAQKQAAFGISISSSIAKLKYIEGLDLSRNPKGYPGACSGACSR